MKVKFIVPLLALTLVFSFAIGCSNSFATSATTTTKMDTTTQTTIAQATTTTKALGFWDEENQATTITTVVETTTTTSAKEGKEDLNTTEASPEETDSATLSEKNAALKARDYLDYSAFSYSGLVEQLEFEGFTHEEAVYGVDRCGADWNEQAALKARDYLDYSAFSRTELIAQLEFEGFTRQQAEYGAQAVGY